MHVLILGAGFSGKAIAKAFLPLAQSVAGTTRAAEKCAALAEVGMDAVVYDGVEISPELAAVMKKTTHLIQSSARSAGSRSAWARSSSRVQRQVSERSTRNSGVASTVP